MSVAVSSAETPLHAETVDFGMWVFLTSEVLFFGVLFVAYTMTRLRFPEAFAAAGHHTSLPLGTLNTAVLLTSSLTMALAVERQASARYARAALLLAVTAALGVAFVAIKGTEYVLEYREHLVPALDFRFDDRYATGARLFFWLYFVITGLHALHLIVGIALALTSAHWMRTPDPQSKTARIRLVGLYWHFVDIVWIFVFPCLYLVSRT
jgi:cytochrome c oxidase subunit 3